MEESKPTVTFIMPAYNVENYIELAVNSIKNQTIEDWELIIIDDGSSDSTSSIASKLAENDNRIQYLKMPQRSGSAYQPRKYGFERAKSEWVAPLDADDWIEETYLEQLLNLQKLTNADIVYPSMYAPDDKEGKLLTPKDQSMLNAPFRGKECVKYTLDGWRINCNGGIIRKEIYFNAYSLFDSSVKYSCADELLTRQILSLTPTVAFSPAKYFYRPNEDSITRKPSVKLFDFLINNITLTDFTKKIYSKDSEEYLLAQRQNFHGIFNAYRILNKFKFDKEIKTEALNLIKKSKGSIDFPAIKGRVSPRYLKLLSFPPSITQLVLKIFDSKKKSTKSHS